MVPNANICCIAAMLCVICATLVDPATRSDQLIFLTTQKHRYLVDIDVSTVKSQQIYFSSTGYSMFAGNSASMLPWVV